MTDDRNESAAARDLRRDQWANAASLRELVASGALEPPRRNDVVFRAALTYALVLLRDILWAADKAGARIATRDFVEMPGGGDLTDLIVSCRNAACHSGSALRRFGPSVFSWLVLRGAGTMVVTDEGAIGSPYEDDVAIFFGQLRLLMVRNLQPAIDQAIAFVGER